MLAWPVQAEPAPSNSTATITLAQVLELVERDNPGISAARENWRAAQKRVVQAGTPDKPVLGLERMYAPADRNVLTGAAERNISITQETPFPTTLYLRHSRAAQETQIAEQSYQAKVREVLAKAESAYAMLFLSYRSLDIFNENVEIMRRFSKVAEARFAAGHSGQLDALKAQVELTKMLNMAVEAQREKDTNEAMLDELLDRDARSPLGAPADPNPGQLDLKLDSLQATALAQRPELRQAFLEAKRARTDLSLAKSEFVPDLMLQYRYRNDPTRGNSNDAILGLSLPLWFWKPAAMVEEAKAQKRQSEARLQSMEVETSADLKTAWLRAQTAQRLADIYQTSLLPQASEALSVAETGYQAGDNSFLDLLDAQRSLLGYRLDYYQYLAEYERRLAELERIVGQELRKP